MRLLRPAMKDSAFAFWSAGREQLPVGWEEALRRLAEEAEKEEQAG